MATIASLDTDWRDAMTREDRIKVCQHIMQKLSTFYQMVPEQTLREKTSAFESQAYTHAESRTDYLRRVAGGLSNFEREATANASASGSPNVWHVGTPLGQCLAPFFKLPAPFLVPFQAMNCKEFLPFSAKKLLNSIVLSSTTTTSLTWTPLRRNSFILLPHFFSCRQYYTSTSCALYRISSSPSPWSSV